MGVRLGRLSGRFGIAIGTAAALFAANPAGATSVNSQESSLHEELDRFAAALKAQSERLAAAAGQAARRALEDNQDRIGDVKSELKAQIETFRALLNEQKAIFGMIGEDAAATLDAWTDEAVRSWAEMHRSALEALDRLNDWLEQPSAPDDTDEPIHV
jgi:phosphoenolpyruvate-protein kinase (PTS system EI component)